jgi:hypothetical protein
METLSQNQTTYSIESGAGDAPDTVRTYGRYGEGEYDPHADGYPVLHVVTLVEGGDVIARGQTGLYAPAQTWREARDLVGADVGQGDSPVHGTLQGAGDGHVDCWVVETVVRM